MFNEICLILLFVIILIIFATLLYRLYKDSSNSSNSTNKIGGNETSIILISGMQGSGKSYIMDQLKDTKYTVIELDDIMTAAYNNVKNDPAYQQESRSIKSITSDDSIRRKEEERLLTEQIDNSKSDIVLLGMTVSIPDKYEKSPYNLQPYYLKAHDDAELEQWFRRAVKRDYGKLVKDPSAIFAIIENSPVYDIGNDIEMLYGGMGLPTPAQFAWYKKDYEERFVKSIMKGIYQEDIIKMLKE